MQQVRVVSFSDYRRLTTRARRTALAFSLADAGFMDKSDPCVLVYLRYGAIDEWQLQGQTGVTSSQ